MKELNELLRDVSKLTDKQCKILKISGDDEESIKKKVKFIIEVIPSDGPYQGGKFDIQFTVSHRYPTLSPSVQCLTPIYHPNIDDDGEICLSLFEDWSSEYNNLFDCVYGLIFLLKNPNLEDPLSPLFCPEDAQYMDVFLKNVRTSLEGGSVEGFQFKRNLISDGKTNNRKDEAIKDDGITITNT